MLDTNVGSSGQTNNFLSFSYIWIYNNKNEKQTKGNSYFKVIIILNKSNKGTVSVDKYSMSVYQLQQFVYKLLKFYCSRVCLQADGKFEMVTTQVSSI